MTDKGIIGNVSRMAMDLEFITLKPNAYALITIIRRAHIINYLIIGKCIYVTALLIKLQCWGMRKCASWVNDLRTALPV